MADSPPPSTTDCDGRDRRGRFAIGNRLSKGNAAARKAAKCRAKLFATVSTKDFAAVVKQLVEKAKAGESWAVKLLFAYMIGEPLPLDIEERITALEVRYEQHRKSRFTN